VAANQTEEGCLNSALELLFSRLSPGLVWQSTRTLRAIYGEDGAPDDLIAVHIRWASVSAFMSNLTVDPTEALPFSYTIKYRN